MSLSLFVGCLLYVFGPILAVFVSFVGKKSQNIILSMGRFVCILFWGLSSSCLEVGLFYDIQGQCWTFDDEKVMKRSG